MMEYRQKDIPTGVSREEYLSSLKAPETENKLDRLFYRKLGYRLAKKLIPTGVTPNTITIISVVFGVLAGPLFYASTHKYLLGYLGIAFLIIANILDCTDGQLSRLTGKKSKIGRILDGLAGDLWFLSIYISLAAIMSSLYDLPVFWLVALLSMISHFVQAALTDYYKTVHLRFIDEKTGAEFDTEDSVKAKYAALTDPKEKLFFLPYKYYTLMQIRLTPELQRLLHSIDEHYPQGQLPEKLRLKFRQLSLVVMRAVDFMTFNGRSIVLFLSVVFQVYWFYFAYEIIMLNLIMLLSRSQHEAICKLLTGRAKLGDR